MFDNVANNICNESSVNIEKYNICEVPIYAKHTTETYGLGGQAACVKSLDALLCFPRQPYYFSGLTVRSSCTTATWGSRAQSRANKHGNDITIFSKMKTNAFVFMA